MNKQKFKGARVEYANKYCKKEFGALENKVRPHDYQCPYCNKITYT